MPVEKMEFGLKPIVRDSHLPFPLSHQHSTAPFLAAMYAQFCFSPFSPPACGQNGRRSSHRVWLTEVIKLGTKTSVFCLNDMQQSIEMIMVLQCPLL